MMGININCKHQDFIGQILSGNKIIETRNTASLNPYIGHRIGLIRTGQGKATLEGFATIKGTILYKNSVCFDFHYDLHRVDSNSPYYIKDNGVKIGYLLKDVEAIKPQLVSSRGIIARNIGQPLFSMA